MSVSKKTFLSFQKALDFQVGILLNRALALYAQLLSKHILFQHAAENTSYWGDNVNNCTNNYIYK